MLVTVANFTEPWEAHMFRGRLEAEGIPAFVAHELHVGNNWPLGLGLGGAKVQVSSASAKDARNIERRCIAGEYRREILEQFDQADERCLSCGATDFKSRPNALQATLSIVATAVFGIVFPFAMENRHCRICGTNWVRHLPD